MLHAIDNLCNTAGNLLAVAILTCFLGMVCLGCVLMYKAITE